MLVFLVIYKESWIEGNLEYQENDVSSACVDIVQSAVISAWNQLLP